MSASASHGLMDQALQGIHVPYQWTASSTANREAGTLVPATALVATDVGKICRQTDNNTLWLLTATTPTWALVGFSPLTGRAIRTTNQSITSGVLTAISFDTEVYDHPGGMIDIAGNPTRVTAPIAGVYAFQGVVRFAANATGERTASVRVSGGTLVGSGSEGNPSGANDSVIVVAGEINLTAAQYLELMCFQNSGVALNALAQASYTSYLSVSLVRPL